MKAMNLMSALYKSFVVRNAFRDASKFIIKNLRDVEWDREYWLHKVGLTPYKPLRSSFGGLGLFLLGLAAGSMAALSYAPGKGEEFRAQVKDRAKSFMGKAQMAAEKISSEIPARV